MRSMELRPASSLRSAADRASEAPRHRACRHARVFAQRSLRFASSWRPRSAQARALSLPPQPAEQLTRIDSQPAHVRAAAARSPLAAQSPRSMASRALRARCAAERAGAADPAARPGDSPRENRNPDARDPGLRRSGSTAANASAPRAAAQPRVARRHGLSADSAAATRGPSHEEVAVPWERTAACVCRLDPGPPMGSQEHAAAWRPGWWRDGQALRFDLLARPPD